MVLATMARKILGFVNPVPRVSTIGVLTDGGKRAKEALDLVHSDVCGKLAKSLGGAEYFLTFVDDKTRFTWVYLLKKKDQVFQYFLEWKAMVENSCGRKLKVLRSDNGGEYMATHFQEYLKSEGVRHELTVPKTPQQNGVAERLNRTLVEMVRTMLIESNLDQRFWGETLSTAVYLRNRSPTKAVIGMTPFEALHGKKPNVKHLRAFGCASYPLIMKDERKKLDPVAKRCVLVGYGTEVKGYRLYDPSRCGKVFYSRDVKFNEMEFGLDKETGSVKSSVELDVSSPILKKWRSHIKALKLMRRQLQNRVWNSREYAGRLELGRGQITLWKRCLLRRITWRNRLRSRKLLQVRRMSDGRKPWKLRCIHYEEMMHGSWLSYQGIASRWGADGCLR